MASRAWHAYLAKTYVLCVQYKVMYVIYVSLVPTVPMACAVLIGCYSTPRLVVKQTVPRVYWGQRAGEGEQLPLEAATAAGCSEGQRRRPNPFGPAAGALD